MPDTDPIASALALLEKVNAPPRLLKHGTLVAEAAQLLVEAFAALGITIDTWLVLSGAVLHDAGKSLHPHELDGPGSDHEEAGQALLLSHGVDARLARCCVSHARWRDLPDVTFEELLVALADKLWKGVRVRELEERVIDEAASRSTRARWDLFVPLDAAFERIADGGQSRLERSRHHD